jgi:multidrug efflux pump subunit AcrA (membrane-fusion protein)
MKLISTLNGRTSKIIFGCAIIVVIIAAGLYNSRGETETIDTYNVSKGEFRTGVEITGTIEAHQSRIIKGPSSLGLSQKILKIAPEGSNVEEGDFVISFDNSDLEKKLKEQADKLEEKEKEYESLLINHSVDSTRLERQLKMEELTFEKAKIDYSLVEFESDNTKRKAKIEMQKAEIRYSDKLDEIESKKIKKREELKKKLREIQKQKNLCSSTQRQIDGSVVNAPIPGLVVYKEIYVSGKQEKIRVGMTAAYHNALIELPDLSKMLVKLEVNEMDYAMLEEGQKAEIKLVIDDRILSGEVKEVPKMARVKYTYNPPEPPKKKNVFDVVISIDSTAMDRSIKPGMKAVCYVVFDSFTDVVSVPVRSVFEGDDETFVYLFDDGEYIKTQVKTGVRNDDYVIIEDGLESGMKITIGDPFRISSRSIEKPDGK